MEEISLAVLRKAQKLQKLIDENKEFVNRMERMFGIHTKPNSILDNWPRSKYYCVVRLSHLSNWPKKKRTDTKKILKFLKYGNPHKISKRKLFVAQQVREYYMRYNCFLGSN